MERKAQPAEDMALQLQASKRSKLYDTKPAKYNEISDAIKTEALQNSIAAQRSILSEAYRRGRVDLNDAEAVRAQADEYMRACETAATFPTMLAFAASLGISRQRLYAYIRENPFSKTTEFLDQLRSSWAAIIAQASLSKMADPATSIFLLKNGGQGLTDRQELEVVPPKDPLAPVTDPEERRRRIMEKYADIIIDEEE